MRDAQARVWAFQQHHQLQAPPEVAALELVAEMGRVAEQLLRRTGRGGQPALPGAEAELHEELGDLAYTLLALANALEVDLDTALVQAMVRYEARLPRPGDAGHRAP